MKSNYLFVALLALVLMACTSSNEDSESSSRVVRGDDSASELKTTDEETASGEFVAGPVALEGFFKESNAAETDGNDLSQGTEFTLSRLNQEITLGVLESKSKAEAVSPVQVEVSRIEETSTTDVPSVQTSASTTAAPIQPRAVSPATTAKPEPSSTTVASTVTTAPPVTQSPVTTAAPTTQKPTTTLAPAKGPSIGSASANYRRAFWDPTELMVTHITRVECTTGDSVVVAVVLYNPSGVYQDGFSTRRTCMDSRVTVNGVFNDVYKSIGYSLRINVHSDLGSDTLTISAKRIDIF